MQAKQLVAFATDPSAALLGVFANGKAEVYLDSAKVRDTVIGGEFKGTVMGDVKYGPDGSAGFQIGTFQWCYSFT